MNQELRALFVADQVERNDHPDYDTPEYYVLSDLLDRTGFSLSPLLTGEKGR